MLVSALKRTLPAVTDFLRPLSYSPAIVSDTGTELTSNAMLAWSEERSVAWAYIQPGKPVRDTFSRRA